VLGAVRRGDGVFECDGRHVRVRAFPVGIATRVFARAARMAATIPTMRELQESLGGQQLILGVDRLDYTKGIPQRMQAFGQFLDRNPEWMGNVTFLQLTPKSRSEVPEYAELDEDVCTLVGQINGTRPTRPGRPSVM
jgi:trehalose 6-phosphate synthase